MVRGREAGIVRDFQSTPRFEGPCTTEVGKYIWLDMNSNKNKCFYKWHTLISKDTSGFKSNTVFAQKCFLCKERGELVKFFAPLKEMLLLQFLTNYDVTSRKLRMS